MPYETECHHMHYLCPSLFTRVNKRRRVLVSERLHPQTIAVVKTRCQPLGLHIEVGDLSAMDLSAGDVTGILFQYPDTEGSIEDHSELVRRAHDVGVSVEGGEGERGAVGGGVVAL